MMEIRYWENAKKHLLLATNEINQPESNTIGFSICKHAQLSIQYYLWAYLESKKISFDKDDSINNLWDKCISLNPKFKEIKMNDVKCSSNRVGDLSCDYLDQKQSCIQIADQMEELITVI